LGLDFSQRRVDTFSMVHVALTLWFTLTTLIGPWFCCCSFASTPHTSAGVTQEGPVSQPVKSCCQSDTNTWNDGGKPSKLPEKHPQCPCKNVKQVNTLPTTAPVSIDLAAQLKLFETVFVGFSADYTIDSLKISSAFTNTSPPHCFLAGRDLLATFCTLRC